MSVSFISTIMTQQERGVVEWCAHVEKPAGERANDFAAGDRARTGLAALRPARARVRREYMVGLGKRLGWVEWVLGRGCSRGAGLAYLLRA